MPMGAVCSRPHICEPLNGFRIVLVEDDTDTLELQLQVLRHQGATVTAAETAREALALVAEADIVVTD